MKVKGFIVEDNRGGEVVLVCEQPSDRSAKMFALRGWQRRRLVPLQYTEQERRQIVAQVLLTLNDLFLSLPSRYEDLERTSLDNAVEVTHVLGAVMEEDGERAMN
ncbi:MAG: hypothetical protein OEY28_10385 [Nitrospira sp.]|nr:hypothetical protein [Nitrospira sp.]